MIESRKDDHIKLALKEDVETGDSFFDRVFMVHNALPEIDFDDVDPSIELFGKKLSFPFIIGALTGGTETAKKINENLAQAAEEFGIGMYVGSQRIAIEKPETAESFRVVKEYAPSALKIANLGAPQISRLDDKKLVDWANTAIDMISADALAVHLNPAQEVFQPEGEPWFRNVIDKLRVLRRAVNKPLIIKEVGSGISMEVVKALSSVAPDAIDVAGSGGTSFIRVESMRRGDLSSAEVFRNWGIPTVISICEVSSLFDGIIIASGGVRSGLDGAKAIAVGADAFSMSRPMLIAAMKGLDELKAFIGKIMWEFKVSMFLTGSKNVAMLKNAPVVADLMVLSWLAQRGVKCKLTVNVYETLMPIAISLFSRKM